MKNKSIQIIFTLCIFLNTKLIGQQQPEQVIEELSPDDFTTLLKNEWMFLRDGIDQLNTEIGQKDEFETTQEFQERALRNKQEFLNKLSKHTKDNKIDRKIFSVNFKANLNSYDADSEIYSISSSTTIEAPYNLPTVECYIPYNPYIELSDSIKGGYRISYIRLKFDPDFKLKIARSEAKSAKASASLVVFRVNFILRLEFDAPTITSKLNVIPKEIALINLQNKSVYWKEEIK